MEERHKKGGESEMRNRIIRFTFSTIYFFIFSFFRSPLNKDILKTHEDIEELLESHLMDCNSQGEKLAYLMVTMQNAEDLVSSDSG